MSEQPYWDRHEKEHAATRWRRETAALRGMLVNPAVCYLHTDGRDRWLTDKYVMACVTQWAVAEDMPDGEYRLMASKGLVPTDRGILFEVADFLAYLEDLPWRRVCPTQWSVTDSEAKLVLCWFTWEDGSRTPVLINGDSWRAFHRWNDEIEFSYAQRVFRVSGSWGMTIGYVAAGEMPDGQLEVARGIVNLSDGTAPSWRGL